MAHNRYGENPEYAPTDKHKPGGWGTTMDLSDDVAQEILEKASDLDKQKHDYFDHKIYEFHFNQIT